MLSKVQIYWPNVVEKNNKHSWRKLHCLNILLPFIAVGYQPRLQQWGVGCTRWLPDPCLIKLLIHFN